MKTDVTIVGAGPVGVITALRLKRMGIDCAIFEKSEELNIDLRASTFHPPTLDYLDSLNLSAPLIERGLICLLYTSPSPRDQRGSRMPSSA